MNFADMVTHSVLARFLAIILLALIMFLALIIAFVDLIEGHDIPAIIQTILGIGIGTAGTLIGINFGVVLQPVTEGKNNATN